MSEWIGWVATAIFAASYFCKEAVGLRRLQALAASLWIAYGVLIGAPPVIVANVIVAAMAIASSWKQRALPVPEDPNTLGDT
jgi:hypothetical protein